MLALECTKFPKEMTLIELVTMKCSLPTSKFFEEKKSFKKNHTCESMVQTNQLSYRVEKKLI